MDKYEDKVDRSDVFDEVPKFQSLKLDKIFQNLFFTAVSEFKRMEVEKFGVQTPFGAHERAVQAARSQVGYWCKSRTFRSPCQKGELVHKQYLKEVTLLNKYCI